MRFQPELQRGTLVRRYKRFLADIETPDGVLTVHCPNTGAMTGCSDPGSEAWFSHSDNPKRKYAHTLEVVRATDGLVGVNPSRANALVREAVTAGLLPGIDRSSDVEMEVPIPDGGGRFDLGLGPRNAPTAVIEVKSVTLHLTDGLGAFPDAVSDRAIKHVQALARCVEAGIRALLVFCVQHEAVERVQTADHIDPRYGLEVARAIELGVEVVALGASLRPEEIVLDRALQFVDGV